MHLSQEDKGLGKHKITALSAWAPSYLLPQGLFIQRCPKKNSEQFSKINCPKRAVIKNHIHGHKAQQVWGSWSDGAEPPGVGGAGSEG